MIAMELVGNAGESRSLSFEALSLAREGNFDEAEEKLKGSCGMGDMELTLTGKAAEYNYELKCGLGNLELDDSLETSITSGNKQITNEGATKNIKLDCGRGNVQVEFEED